MGLQTAVHKIWSDPVASKILGSLGYAVLCTLSGVVALSVAKNSTVFAIVAGLIATELFLLWFVFRSTASLLIPGGRDPFHRTGTRRAAAIAALIVPTIAPLSALCVAYKLCRQNDKTVIYIANFESRPGLDSYRVTRTIYEHLKQSLAAYPDLSPKLLDRSVPWNAEPDSVMTWCEKEANGMIIWGDVDKKRDLAIVTAHFRVRRSGSPLSGSNERRFALGDLERFVVQDRVSSGIAYVTLLATGIILFERANHKAAIERLTAAIHEGYDCDFNPALFYRGRAYFAIGDFTKAIADFSNIVEVQDKYPYALNNRGAARVAAGDYANGYLDLSRAIALKPGDGLAYLNRGGALYELHRLEESLADSNRAIEYSGSAVAYMGRANVLDKQGILGGALQDYKRALCLDRENPDIYLNRAIAFYRHNDYGNAIPDLDAAIALHPSFLAYRLKGESLILAGRGFEAPAMLEVAKRLARTQDERKEIDARVQQMVTDSK